MRCVLRRGHHRTHDARSSSQATSCATRLLLRYTPSWDPLGPPCPAMLWPSSRRSSSRRRSSGSSRRRGLKVGRD